MNRRMKFIDNFTAGYIFIGTYVTCMTTSITQTKHMNLVGKELGEFLFGFVGSFICIMIRFGLSYVSISKQNDKRKKVLGLICLSIGWIITIAYLWLALHMARYSLDYQYLFAYNRYQYFMLKTMFALYLGVKIFGIKE